MLRFYIPAFLLLFALNAVAQRAVTTGYRLNPDNGAITVNYVFLDAKSSSFLSVRVQARSNGRLIPLKAVTGDIGRGVNPDGNKKIVWDAFQDNLQDTTGLVFLYEVVALPAKYAQKGDKLASNSLGPLITMGLGAGIGIAGLAPYGKSKKLYSTYESNLNPTSSEYSDLSRDDHFDQANDKYRNAQIMFAAGGVVLLSGVIAWAVHNKRAKQWNRVKSWSVAPGVLQTESAPRLTHNGNAPMGMTLSLNLNQIKR